MIGQVEHRSISDFESERRLKPNMYERLRAYAHLEFRKREPYLRRFVMCILRLIQAPIDAGGHVELGMDSESTPHLMAYQKTNLIGHYPVAFTHNKKMILDASINDHVLMRSIYANIKRSIRKPFKKPKLYKYSNMCIFSNTWSSGYFHWTLDDLTRLEALTQFRKYKNSSLKLLMVPPLRVWQLDSLKALGFGEDDLVLWKGGKALVEKLYVSPSRRRDKRALEWLKKNAAKSAGCRKETDASKRIYISRADAKERQVVNEDELFLALKTRGFELYKLSELDYYTQVRLFWEAEFVVGPHGAGLTNMIYTRIGATLFELSPRQDTRGHFERLCYDLGLSYKRMLCDNIGSGIIVDIDKVLVLIDNLLNKQNSF